MSWHAYLVNSRIDEDRKIKTLSFVDVLVMREGKHGLKRGKGVLLNTHTALFTHYLFGLKGTKRGNDLLRSWVVRIQNLVRPFRSTYTHQPHTLTTTTTTTTNTTASPIQMQKRTCKFYKC